jgi:hypothetical protein
MKTFARRLSLMKRVWAGAAAAALAFLFLLVPAGAQTAGEGSIEGTVTDSTGAAVPGATVTITDNATGIKSMHIATGAGFFSISPVLPGTYTVKVEAKGFETLVQDNVVVDALQTRTLAPVLAVGAASQTVTVTGAPPVLDTADATIQLTMENTTYSNLPIQTNNAQRDPTAFGILSPGSQSGSRLPVIGGTGNYLGQLYLDGMPADDQECAGGDDSGAQAAGAPERALAECGRGGAAHGAQAVFLCGLRQVP